MANEEHTDANAPVPDETPAVSGETAAATESEPILEHMEVHHHPDLKHKRKHLREYLLEFLMIFMAVTMGFIAENYREKRINREKERNYVENLYRDLKGEQRTLAETIKANDAMIAAIDTLVKIRALDFNQPDNNRLFFKLFAKTKMYSPNIFRPNEVTMSQIKSTGGLNIITPKMADLIAQLDMSNQHVKWGEKFPYTHGEETFRMIYELTDYPSIWTPTFELSPNLPPLDTSDPKKLMKFFNLSVDLMYTLQGYNDYLYIHSELIKKVSKALKAGYALEE